MELVLELNDAKIWELEVKKDAKYEAEIRLRS